MQSLKEQLSLIASRLILEVLSNSESKAYVQIGHLHLSGHFILPAYCKSLCSVCNAKNGGGMEVMHVFT